MKSIIKKIVAFSAIIPIAVGIGLTAINGDVSQEARGASTLLNSFNFLNGGSNDNNASLKQT